jgi:hypothetical protein
MLRRVAPVTTDVSEETSASIIRAILITPRLEALSSSETSVHTRAPWRNIPEDGILHSHRREDLRSYIHIILIFAALYLTKLAMDRLVITSVRAAHMNTPAAVSHDISKKNQMCN